MVQLQLRVPLYIKKILTLKYGETFHAKENTMLGMAIYNVLKKKSYYKRYSYNPEKLKRKDLYRFKELSEEYGIKISVDRATRRGFEIDENKAHRILRIIDNQIREELYRNAIINKERYDIEYQTTLLDFLDLYEIEEADLSYESLRKDFNRSRIKIMQTLKIVE